MRCCRGKVTDNVMGSYYVIPLQEAASHFPQGRSNCFGTVPPPSRRGPSHLVSQEYGRTWRCTDRRSDPRHVKAGLFRREILDGPVYPQEGAQARAHDVHTCLRSPEQHDREEARTWKKTTLGQTQGSRREKRPGPHCRRLQQFGLSRTRKGERGKAKISSIEEAWEETLLRLGSNGGSDW